MTSTVDNPALASVHWQTTLVGSDRDHDHTRSSGEYQTGTGHTPRENPQPTAPRPKNVMSLEAILSPVSSDDSSPSTGSGNHREAHGPRNAARQTPQRQLESSAHVSDQPQPYRVTTSPILPILVHPTPARRSLSIHPRPPPVTAPYIAPLPAPPTCMCSHAAHRKVESWAHPSSSTISGWTPPPIESPSTSRKHVVDPPGSHLWRYNRHDRQDQILALAEAQSIEDALAIHHHHDRTVPTTAPRGGIAPSLTFAITNAIQRERTCAETDSIVNCGRAFDL
ncbi:hypothetical protein EW146_g4842 [Bondarzewia mesenterica]|uniref:Uncharacterized protein n=1 Tax=Bondarzewia mesenterica TaxID=1095465 RepID=A0A4S4LV49_9AGAM|nr:hypothetical protein EW146_g4842 [Bondarzewia mesenterica]